MPADKLILITGATSYVGGRLLPLLVQDGCRVRCLARQPERLASRVPGGVAGDVLDAASLSSAKAAVPGEEPSVLEPVFPVASGMLNKLLG